MASFRGRYDYTVDAKGRVNVPAKFRKGLKPDADGVFTVVIVRGPEDCLRVYPEGVWEARNAELSARPETPEVVQLKRRQNDSLSDSSLDVQGRISLSAHQMAISGIAKEGKVIILGMDDYMELWDASRYQQNQESLGEYSKMYYTVQNGSSDS